MTPTQPSFKPPLSITLIGIALAVAILLAPVFLFHSHRQAPSHPPPEENYASNIVITGIKTSQTTSVSGVRTVTLEGHIANHGPATVTEIDVNVVFDNDNDADLESHTLPVNITPLTPHSDRNFHLDLQNIGENWNQQQPEIQILNVQTR
jgi:hypothetical protein